MGHQFAPPDSPVCGFRGELCPDAGGQLACAQNPLHTFPRNFPVDGEIANLLPIQICCGLIVSDTSNKLATSRCKGIWETTRHNRHNGLLPAPTCYRLVVYVADLLCTCYGEVANLLRTCYGETGVMDFCL